MNQVNHGTLIPHADAENKVTFKVKDGTPFVQVKSVIPTVGRPETEYYFTTWNPALLGDGEQVITDLTYTARYEKIEYTLSLKKLLNDVYGNPIEEKKNFKVEFSGPSFPDEKIVSIHAYEITKLTDLLPGTYSVKLIEGEGKGFKVTITDPVILTSDNPNGLITVTGDAISG